MPTESRELPQLAGLRLMYNLHAIFSGHEANRWKQNGALPRKPAVARRLGSLNPFTVEKFPGSATTTDNSTTAAEL